VYPRLQLISKHIPALDKEREDDPHAGQERDTPQIRCRTLAPTPPSLSCTTRLTKHIRRSPDIQRVVCHPARQIRHTQRIQRLIRQLSHISNDYRRSKEAKVLKSVLLRALGADNLRLGRFVDALVALGVARVGARVLVVKLAKRGCVEVWCDGEDPGGGDGVEGL
jgi:hypothetical protein